MKPLHYSAIASPDDAPRLSHQVHESLRPFIAYLNAAKRAAREREARSWVRWEPVPIERPLRLTPLDSLLELSTEGFCYQVIGFAGSPPEMPLFVGATFRPIQPLRTQVTNEGLQIVLTEEIPVGEPVFWAGQKCVLKLVPSNLPERLVVARADGTQTPIRLRVEAQGRVRLVVDGRDDVTVMSTSGERITHRVLAPEEGATQLRTTKSTLPWNGERTLAVSTPPDEDILTADNAVRWTWAEDAPRGRRKRGVWVQLLPAEGVDSDATMDPRAAYCEEGVRSVRTEKGGREYKVWGFRRDSYRLELSELPPKGTQIFLPANLSGFNQQLNAVYRLKDGPLPYQRGLLMLCEDPSQAQWQPVKPVTIADRDWFLLGNLKWDGTGEQREFVLKALGTQDFAFLEGPPGSGKTHAICELILQLIKQNQRVLLCSTTHVAVDNVLERLVGHFPQVEAVRIGNPERIDKQLLDYYLETRIDRLFENWKADPTFAGISDNDLDAMAEGTILASANLTCGTTTGILRHPYLSRNEEGQTPSWPHFDVLIVDEASKTTLQEFLVPAQLAHRWIIVGDVRQLPPFTEPKDLEASLEEVSEDDRQGANKRLSDAYQRACLLFSELEKKSAGKGQIRWLIDENPDVLNPLASEILARKELDGSGPLIVRLVRNASLPCDVTIADLESGAMKALELLAAHWVLVPTDLLPSVERFLPSDLVRLRSGNDLQAYAFRYNHWVTAKGRFDKPIEARRKQVYRDVTSLRDAIREFFREQTWAKQIAWRLGRVHQLGNAKNATDREERQEEIERLLPVAQGSQWVAAAVDAIRDVGVRSVIEALRVPRTEHRVRRRSALTDAIPAKMWIERSKLLTRQHRMHPEISNFPREQFYDKAALIDANTLVGRDAKIGWTFLSDQPSRRIWVDVVGQEERGANPEEVEAMRQVLEAWRAWAATNPRKDGKRWEVACLSFYNKQELAIRDMLRQLTKQQNAETRFDMLHTRIASATVDRFQGREADLVLLSFRNTQRTGHADSPNRLNVAITRARFQLVLFGNKSYFEDCYSDELSELALATPRAKLILRSP